ncbi:MAG: hypothetical protein M5U24_02935 [Candidatus Kuenenia sp.]|uniref:hypothetical protein n=1 Tax=Candidatus Kuenenia sp. TaxID=2499824 RepID=UPI0022BBAC80|nr:hypothetical protein [Candidatus Kuenenia sp.]MCZ7621429.1 hypothetical protein [Candidatus Kuenenia sp.]
MICNLIFRRFTVGSYPINGYLVADPETRVGVFIDPGGFSDEIEAFIRERQILLQYLFFTHGHWDPPKGEGGVPPRPSLKVRGGEERKISANNILQGSEIIEVGALQFKALSTPGHTLHGMSYYIPGGVFTGDALFCGSVGGTNSSKAVQCQTEHIHKHIFTLPDETLVFPAHGPMTTVGIEKYTNPFCQ